MARRFPAPRALALSALVSALLLTACGGGMQNAADGTETRTALPAPDASKSAPQTSGSPTASAGASRTPGATTPSPSYSPSAKPSPSPDTASWTTARKSREAVGDPDESPVLEAVRVGRHATFHRVVFEFSEGTPEFSAEYVRTLRQAGLGRKVEVAGEHDLLLVFRGVTPESHFDATPTTSVIREVKVVSIFEGEARIGVGLTTDGPDRPAFRVDTFGDRVVLDFAHTA